MKVRVLVRLAAVATAFAFAALVIPRTASASPLQRLAFDQGCVACDFSPVHFLSLHFAGNFGFEHTDLAFNTFDGFNGRNDHNPFEGGDIILSKGLFDQPLDNTWMDDDGGSSPAPEPGTLLLLGSGLLGLGAVARKFSLAR